MIRVELSNGEVEELELLDEDAVDAIRAFIRSREEEETNGTVTIEVVPEERV